MSTKDTRKKFEEIVGRLAAEDPSLTRTPRVLPRKTLRVVLALVGALVWAGLSVLMVVWGAAGVALTCGTVLAVAGAGVVLTRRRR